MDELSRGGCTSRQHGGQDARATRGAGRRALDGCTEGSPEETEYIKLIEAIDAYEEQRWPDGKTPGGKG